MLSLLSTISYVMSCEYPRLPSSRAYTINDAHMDVSYSEHTLQLNEGLACECAVSGKKCYSFGSLVEKTIISQLDTDQYKIVDKAVNSNTGSSFYCQYSNEETDADRYRIASGTERTKDEDVSVTLAGSYYGECSGMNSTNGMLNWKEEPYYGECSGMNSADGIVDQKKGPYYGECPGMNSTNDTLKWGRADNNTQQEHFNGNIVNCHQKKREIRTQRQIPTSMASHINNFVCLMGECNKQFDVVLSGVNTCLASMEKYMTDNAISDDDLSMIELINTHITRITHIYGTFVDIHRQYTSQYMAVCKTLNYNSNKSINMHYVAFLERDNFHLFNQVVHEVVPSMINDVNMKLNELLRKINMVHIQLLHIRDGLLFIHEMKQNCSQEGPQHNNSNMAVRQDTCSAGTCLGHTRRLTIKLQKLECELKEHVLQYDSQLLIEASEMVVCYN